MVNVALRDRRRTGNHKPGFDFQLFQCSISVTISMFLIAATDIQDQAVIARGAGARRISDQTVRRRLAARGLHARRMVKKPKLTRLHTAARLQWAQQHSQWTRQQWERVLFTDESRMCLRHIDGRSRVWRRRGEQHADCCIQPVTAYGGGSVMVWGGISAVGKTDLLVIDGRLNSRRYVNKVLMNQVIPYAGAIGDDFILMDDNARPHRGRIVDQFLDEQGVERLNWPANTPDLNPIEHLWDQLKRAVQKRIGDNTTIAMLRQMLVEEWAAIPQQKIRKLVQTMRKRCLEVLEKNGGHTFF